MLSTPYTRRLLQLSKNVRIVKKKKKYNERNKPNQKKKLLKIDAGHERQLLSEEQIGVVVIQRRDRYKSRRAEKNEWMGIERKKEQIK